MKSPDDDKQADSSNNNAHLRGILKLHGVKSPSPASRRCRPVTSMRVRLHQDCVLCSIFNFPVFNVDGICIARRARRTCCTVSADILYPVRQDVYLDAKGL